MFVTETHDQWHRIYGSDSPCPLGCKLADDAEDIVFTGGVGLVQVTVATCVNGLTYVERSDYPEKSWFHTEKQAQAVARMTLDCLRAMTPMAPMEVE